MTGHFAHRLNTTLERWLPEQRLFLKSDTETRFVRLRSTTQAIALVVSVAVVAWPPEEVGTERLVSRPKRS